jgi:drug/metabolite transporter (DMT)-like permease
MLLASGLLPRFRAPKRAKPALLGSAVANTAYLWLLDRISAPVVATYTFVNPVIALFLGWLIPKEQLTLLTVIGAAFVIGSIISLQLPSSAHGRQSR